MKLNNNTYCTCITTNIQRPGDKNINTYVGSKAKAASTNKKIQ